MGNAGVKEEDENGNDDPSVRSDGDQSFLSNDRVGSVDSVYSMGNTPPESPGRCRSPLVFAPQVPVAPLQRAGDVPPILSQLLMNGPQGSLGAPPEKGIPTLITWKYGGNDVSVEGSWDNWTSRRFLQRSGKDHSILLVLPSGVYHYKFFLDGECRYIPDLPSIADEIGYITNLLDVNDYIPENLGSLSEFESPPSPGSSYSHLFPVDEDFAKEPPAIPPQLHFTVLGMQNYEKASTKPRHVILNHLSFEKGWASRSLVALGLTHRFQSKYVTAVLYKPMRR